MAVATYAGWAISDRDRDELLRALAAQHVTPRHARVIAEHVTHAYPSSRPAPLLAAVVVMGHAADDRVQALVVRAGRGTIRPDRRMYHITLSVAPGVEPVESNRLLAGAQQAGVGWELLRPFAVPVTPFLRAVDDSITYYDQPPAGDEQIKAELRAALFPVPCKACGAGVNEPCKVHNPNDPFTWHVMRKQDAHAHHPAASAILRSFGVRPRGRRRGPAPKKGT